MLGIFKSDKILSLIIIVSAGAWGLYWLPLRSIEQAAKDGINIIMWIPTVKALKIKFEAYKNARSEAEKRNVALGEGISLVRDMFVADTMEEAKERLVSIWLIICDGFVIGEG